VIAMAGLLDELEARTGIVSDVRGALERPSQRDAVWAVVLGLLAFQAATGIALSFFYAPTSTDAWASVFWLTHSLPGGAFLRSAHRLGMSVLVGVVGVHLALLAVSGRWRPPREIAWWCSLLLLLLVLAFAITGNPLPWDQRGFWASRVEAGIMASAPGIGALLRSVFLGGNEYGNITLTRFYTLHAFVLPVAVLAVAWLRGRAARRMAPPGSPSFGERLAGELPLAAVAIAALAIAATRFPAPLSAPADLSGRWLARPEWYFLPLNQLVSLVPGPVGSQVLPGIALLLLAALPYVDRPGRRAPALAGLGLCVVAVAGLMALGTSREMRSKEIAGARAVAERKAQRAFVLAAGGVPAEGAALMIQRDPLSIGERVFENRCAGCHRVSGQGTDDPDGPDLGGYLGAEWLREVIRHPEDPRFYGTTKITGMDDYAGKDAAQVEATVQLLRAVRAHPGVAVDDLPPALKPGLAAWEDLGCDSCHELGPEVEGAAPNLSGYGSDAWLQAFVREPGAELHYGDQNEMPRFANKLSDAEIAGVILYLRTLEELPVATPEKLAVEPKR
jgi:ubiquinol-cytochrome c reductase cytochrome b subunit